MLPADRANVKPFLPPDQIRAKLQTRPDRRPVYSYLLRLLCSPTSGRAYTQSYGHGLFEPCLGDAVLNLTFPRGQRGQPPISLSHQKVSIPATRLSYLSELALSPSCPRGLERRRFPRSQR